MTIEVLTLEERETHISQCADDRSRWDVFSEDSVFIAKLRRLGFEPTRTSATGAWFTLPASAVSIRKPRQLDEQKRAMLSERMRQTRARQMARNE